MIRSQKEKQQGEKHTPTYIFTFTKQYRTKNKSTAMFILFNSYVFHNCDCYITYFSTVRSTHTRSIQTRPHQVTPRDGHTEQGRETHFLVQCGGQFRVGCDGPIGVGDDVDFSFVSAIQSNNSCFSPTRKIAIIISLLNNLTCQ